MIELEFPQIKDIVTEIFVKYSVKGEDRESKLKSKVEFLNDTVPKLEIIGLLVINHPALFGYYEAVVPDNDEFCVKFRSSVRDNYTILIPIDEIIGWFEIKNY